MKWKTLVHQGVAFPPEYEPKGFRIKIRGKAVPLIPFQEEMAVAWAKKKETPYVQDPVFQKNFLSDFLKNLPPEFRDVRIDEIDFSEIHQDIAREKALYEDKDRRKKRAAERKAVREELKAKYGWAEVDGQVTEVANYMVEPPGIFMGRGDHPMRGLWKPRIHARDVTLNLGEDAPRPEGDWKEIVHDHRSTWLARWIDKLSEKEKYVWLHDSTPLRQERDRAKYEKARTLARQYGRVIRKIREAMRARDPRRRMAATTAYLICTKGIRVGDEKDPDEADTVGASTLRVEHVAVRDDQTVELDFLGKDSVRYRQTFVFDGEDRVFVENLRKYLRGKKPQELVFSDVDSRTVNAFLGSILKGMTAKVFRTCLATQVVTDHLAKLDAGALRRASEEERLHHARVANLRAAVTCNHKRTPPKNFEESLQRKRDRLAKIEDAEVKTDKARERRADRIEKAKLQLQLAIETRDYNLGTSLRNYIDPRVVKSWCDHVGADWMKLYTKVLQRKFQWVARSAPKWKTVLAERARPDGEPDSAARSDPA